jgi:hypothetical protein
MKFDLTQFSLTDMLRCGSALRHDVQGAETMEDSAQRICRGLYEMARDSETGARQCALVRLYKTHPFAELEPDLQAFARAALQEGETIEQRTKCLVLLGSAGDEPYWNDRRRSRAHRAIPLGGPRIQARAPMIATMIRDFGLDVDQVADPAPTW